MPRMQSLPILGLLLTALAFAAGYAIGQAKPPAETKGQSIELLRSIDLTDELTTTAGYKLRLSRITLNPGGAVTLHNHKDRPTVSVMLQGVTTYHPEGKPDVELKPGDGLADGKATTHWLENRGAVPAVWIAASVAK